jgi:hypothetical protein
VEGTIGHGKERGFEKKREQKRRPQYYSTPQALFTLYRISTFWGVACSWFPRLSLCVAEVVPGCRRHRRVAVPLLSRNGAGYQNIPKIKRRLRRNAGASFLLEVRSVTRMTYGVDTGLLVSSSKSLPLRS